MKLRITLHAFPGAWLSKTKTQGRRVAWSAIRCSLSHSQQPATCPYPEPDQASPCPIRLLADPF